MGMRIFTESGTFNPADYGLTSADMIDVICVGGGESGQTVYFPDSKAKTGYGRGGNSGYVRYYSGKCPANSIAVTVGKGYAAPSDVSGTAAGGSSSFGSLCTASGGYAVGGGACGGVGSANKLGGNTNYCGGGGAGGYIPSSPQTSFFNGVPGASEGVFYGSGGMCGHSLNTSGLSGSGGGGGCYGGHGTRGGAFGGEGGICATSSTDKGSGGGGGGGYGAGGGGAASGYANTSGYTNSPLGGKGADGCVIVFW